MRFAMVRLKSLIPWLAEARYAGLSLGVIAMALIVSLRPHTREPVIRLTGLVLQLLGVGTVMWGISATRAFFGRPSLASHTKSWLSRFPLLRHNVVVGVGGVSLSAAAGHVRAHVTYGPGPNPTVDARIDALEKNIASIHERITHTQNDIDKSIQEAGEALRLEAQTRRTENMAIREKLEATGTGGLHISAIGALWFFAGTILSTAAGEISTWLK